VAGPGFSNACFWESSVARTLLARIDFQLGTNEAHLTADKLLWQVLVHLPWLAEQYGASFAGWEGGQRAVMAEDLLFLCSQMKVWGAVVHIWCPRCNTPATALNRLANALTGELSQ